MIGLGELFRYNNLFFRVTGRLWDLFVLNLLWALFSLPLVTAGASTLALYTVLSRIQAGEEGYLFRDFWQAFRKNLKKGLKVELLLAAAGIMIPCSILFWGQRSGMIPGVCMVLSMASAFLYLLMLLYLFQVLVFMDIGIGASIMAAFVAAAQNLPRTLLMLAMIVSTVALAVYSNPAAMVFFCIGVSGLCYMLVFLGPWKEGIREKDTENS
ncbi:MAG: YesL family protein [Lachnospiraceae bacterium]|nr:YesL family protein [Lachnospiraceae bacterium]